LFLTGDLSNYVLTKNRSIIQSLFTKAKFAKIKQAGHWLHAEKPREFADTVRTYLDTAVF
jgi:esterase